jgi:hypothetical protein
MKHIFCLNKMTYDTKRVHVFSLLFFSVLSNLLWGAFVKKQVKRCQVVYVVTVLCETNTSQTVNFCELSFMQ